MGEKLGIRAMLEARKRKEKFASDIASAASEEAVEARISEFLSEKPETEDEKKAHRLLEAAGRNPALLPAALEYVDRVLNIRTTVLNDTLQKTPQAVGMQAEQRDALDIEDRKEKPPLFTTGEVVEIALRSFVDKVKTRFKPQTRSID